MPTLRNPGLYSVILFGLMAAIVVALFVFHVEDAPRLAVELFALGVTAFGARSALATKGPAIEETTATMTVERRAKMNTWPEIAPVSDVEVELVDEVKK